MRLHRNTRRHIPEEEEEAIPEYTASHSRIRSYTTIHSITFQKTRLYQTTWRHAPEDEAIPEYVAPHPRKRSYTRIHSVTYQNTKLYQNTWRHIPENEAIPQYTASRTRIQNYTRIHGVTFQKTRLYQNTRRHISEDKAIPEYTATHFRRRGYTSLHGVTSRNTVTFTFCAVEAPPSPNLILLYTKSNIPRVQNQKWLRVQLVTQFVIRNFQIFVRGFSLPSSNHKCVCHLYIGLT
jgi:hypothetical protein